MSLFTTRQPGSVTLEGETALHGTHGDGSMRIDVSTLDWIGFLFVGDEFSPVYEGWWLFGRAAGSIAIGVDCPRVDWLLRHAPLAVVADPLEDKVQIDVASRPRELRGDDARDGIVHLDAMATAALRARGVSRHVQSILAFPDII